MASVCSSSFNCFTSSYAAGNPAAPAARGAVRFQKLRPAAAVCAAVSETSTASTLYDVLGVRSEATCHEIKAAYRQLARVLHPDVAAANGQNDASSAAVDFIRVHEAYATLSDPSKRDCYDRDMAIRRRFGEVSSFNGGATTSSRGASGSRYTRRSWETDQCW